LTQQVLAQRAGVTQSVVSAYESGRREPALSTLARLIRATGHELAVGIRRGTDSQPTSPLAERLMARRLAVVETAARHGAHDVRLFGSVARGEDGPHSDIDLLVTLSPGTGMLALARLQRDLERVLEAPVDVIPDDGVKPRVWQRIQRELVAL
jgi:predicted nucleotidyltransferase/DNA-binding XRE family transcriptional regulator